MVRTTYAKLTPWQKVQVARHPERPHTLEYSEKPFEDYVPLAGDRAFAEDRAIAGGLAGFNGRTVCGRLGDAGKDIGEPSLRVDVVELGGDDKGVHRRGSGTSLTALENRGAASPRNTGHLNIGHLFSNCNAC